MATKPNQKSLAILRDVSQCFFFFTRSIAEIFYILIGSSDHTDAKSLYLIPSTNYAKPAILKTGLGRIWCVAQNGSDIYFSDLHSIKYFGSNGIIKTFYNSGVMSISFSSQYLYYADEFGGKVGRINIQTGLNETLASNLNGPKTVRYDPPTNKLYILELGTQANKFKDGTLKVMTPEKSNNVYNSSTQNQTNPNDASSNLAKATGNTKTVILIGPLTFSVIYRT